MNSRALEIWLDERWYEALSQQLKNETVEDKLNEYLEQLIDQLPKQVYEKISGEIRAEDQLREQEEEANRRYSAFRVTENGATEYFQVEQAVEMLNCASYVRRWLRQTEQRPFRELLSGSVDISAEEYDRMAAGCAEGDGKITAAFDVDLDRKEFSAVRLGLGWISYRLKDVSTASWHSYRTGSYDRGRRETRFTQKLAGREIVSAGHLGAENISFTDEIIEDDGRLNFYLENVFNVDKVFGTHVCTARNNDWLNVYANYDMTAGQVCDTLELVLNRADGKDEELTYPLNAVEKAVLLRKMEDYCQQQNRQSLTEYSAQLMAEDLMPPAGPVMQ